MTTRMLGERIARLEDPRLLTGNGRYLDDLGHDALAAAFVRSPHAHARITRHRRHRGARRRRPGRDLHLRRPRSAGRRPAARCSSRIRRSPTPAPATAWPRTRSTTSASRSSMVVATDRYVAEDAAERIAVTYEPLPAVVGVAAARAAEHLVHDDVPGNVAADMVQEVRRRARGHRGRAARPRARPRGRAQRVHADGGQGRPRALGRRRPHAAGAHVDPDVDQRPVPRCPPSSGSPPDRIEVIAPDVGGGFGVKIVHPWPEEVLVPWAAIRLDREVKWVEDRREHFVSSAHEREQHLHVRVGFDDDGIILGLDVTFWHDNGAYTPYGIIVPIITLDAAARSVQAGRLPRGVLQPLHEHRHRHAVPRRRSAAGRASRWSARWTRSRTSSALTGPRCGRATSSSRTRCRTTTA